MAARRVTIDEATLDAVANRAAARTATVAVEQMQGQFRAFGESLDGLREQMTRGFAEVNRRFEQVDQRFDRVEQRLDRVESVVLVHERQLREVQVQLREVNAQLVDLRVAVDRKVDRDEVEGIVARAGGH